MIEIEKKFLLTSAQKQSLLHGAHEIGERAVTDSYYDTQQYKLTTNDIWFRERDGAYELKAPLELKGDSSSKTNRYHELTRLEDIYSKLGLDMAHDFEVALARSGIERFMTCFTRRQSYKKQGFRIDVDTVSYLDSAFTYGLAEIELIVDDESKADEAESQIIAFAEQFNLTTDQVILGKVAAYLKEEKVEHYNALFDAGIFS